MDQSQVFSTFTPKSLLRRLIALFTALLVSPLSPSLLATAQSEEPYRITVMSRNLYLGSDVGVALELIPNFPKAAQFMWDQVKKTDFSARAPKLAR